MNLRSIFLSSLVLLSTCVICVSCMTTGEGNNYFKDIPSYSLKKIKTVDLKSFDSDILSLDSLNILSPKSFISYTPDVLVFSARDRKAQIKVLDLNSKSVKKLVPTGEGPEEILSVSSLALLDSNLWFGGVMDHRVGLIDMTKDTLKMTYKGALDKGFLYVVPLPDERILSAPLDGDDIRFQIYDKSNKPVETIVEFPIKDQNASNSVFQGAALLSPDKKSMVVLNKSWGLVEVYNAETLKRKGIMYGPDKIDSRIVRQEIPIGYQILQHPSYTPLVGLSVAEDGFFVGYAGAVMEGEGIEPNPNPILKLVKYNYNCKPVMVYNLPEPVKDFTTDKSGKILYCIKNSSDNDNLQLLRATLK